MKFDQTFQAFLVMIGISTIGLAAPDTSKVASPEPTRTDSIQFDVFRSWSADSTMFIGSNYGSFGDIFDQLPGSYFYNRGSVGQQAMGSIFAGVAGQFALLYDGLYLNDLLTGEADLNLIPEESIAKLGWGQPASRFFNFYPIGQTLQIHSRDLAALPVRSRVTYRTGDNGYDNIDARLGILLGSSFKLNLGGVSKNYAGTTLFAKYGTQKWNAGLQRNFGKNWSVRYSLLYNLHDVDVPLYDFEIPLLREVIFPDVSFNHQKQTRYDHGLFLEHTEKYRLAVQYTDLHHEFYPMSSSFFGGYRRSAWGQIFDANRIRIANQLRQKFGALTLSSGVEWQITRLDSFVWDAKREDQLIANLSLVAQCGDKVFIDLGIVQKHVRDVGNFSSPELLILYQLKPSLRSMIWSNHLVYQPSFEARYASGPFAWGHPILKPTVVDQVGGAVEYQSAKVNLSSSVVWQRIQNEIGVAFFPQEFVVQRYINAPEQSRFSWDLVLQTQMSRWALVGIKAHFHDARRFVQKFQTHSAVLSKMMHHQNALDGDEYLVPNLPRIFASGFTQFHRVFFKGDLDARLRFGAKFWDKREAPIPYYTHFSPLSRSMTPVVIPFVHGIFIIKDVTLFVSYENILGADFNVVYPFPMPKSQLRWGFSWTLLD